MMKILLAQMFENNPDLKKERAIQGAGQIIHRLGNRVLSA